MSWLVQWILIPLAVSFLATVLYGFWSSRKRDYRVVWQPESFRLYKEKESNDVSITLSYKNERVGESLMVMIVRLTNSGKKDIAFDQIFAGEIGVSLEKARIIDLQVEKQSEKVGAVVEKESAESDKWLLSWELLKKKEIIDIRIVAVFDEDDELVDTDRLDKLLKFDFRGNNISRIDYASSFHRKIFNGTYMFIILMCALSAVFFPMTVNVRYNIVAGGSRYENATLSFNEFTQTYMIHPKGEFPVFVKQVDTVSTTAQPIVTVASALIVVLCLLFSAAGVLMIWGKDERNWRALLIDFSSIHYKKKSH